MKRKNFLDKIEVKSPCSESWDEMFGNNEVRFCSHCAKNVHDISAMTRQKAEKLVKESNGNLCVRYVKTPNGKLISAPQTLTKITRRATIVASVLATSLTFTSLTYAQGKPIKTTNNKIQLQKDKSKNNDITQELATISGTIKDANDAVVFGAKVTLKDSRTEKLQETKSNDNGEFLFKNVEPSVYELTVESQGFKKSVHQNIEIEKDVILEKIIVLEVGAIMGDLVIIEQPIDTPVTKPSEIIQERGVLELPINGRSFITMGLFSATCPEEKPKNKKSKPKKKKN
jgi:hypothetical protein